jgi:uncharacterized lipoprotein YajG
MKRLLVLLPPIMLLAGCATPESQLRSGLQSAGLSRDTSVCMADKMVHHLSLTQLRRLSSLGSLRDTRIADLTVGQFMHKVRALNDPDILAITTRAGLSCTILG